ncbi:MAG: metallophosphoesterase [Candidatus Marinimicrobia bacterium]|nr:metallophosphoesterase [Candidatus Neomarinimicrobiota bacterium]MBL7046895.1 metallophosphoesterase [Candidatus Neomarinimicrobiota bacterium]
MQEKDRKINKGFSYFTILVTVLLFVLISWSWAQSQEELIKQEADFSFIVTADMRDYAEPEYQTSEYFLGACEAIRDVGKGDFMVSPGDVDPPWHVRSVLDKVLGEDYLWYPVVGNHESETRADMNWLRKWGQNIPYLVRVGPENCEETMYSFDYKNAHFIAINQYCDGKSDNNKKGDIVDEIYHWVKADLEENNKPLVFIFGHEPIVSIPDIDSGRHRHKGINLDQYPENSHRFQKLLRFHDVTAFFCGHTHDASYSFINGIWQFDAGHCRGMGDTGAPSTFLKVWIKDVHCFVEFYRADANGGNYILSHSIVVQ